MLYEKIINKRALQPTVLLALALLSATFGCNRHSDTLDVTKDIPVVIIEDRVYNAYTPEMVEGFVRNYSKQAADEIIRTDPKNPLALFVVASRGDINLVKRLLDLGADVNQKTDFGHYAIHEAVSHEHQQVLDILLAAGAEVNVRVSPTAKTSPSQWSPLHYAAHNGNIQIAQTLISAGANIHAVDYWGKKPIHYARKQGHQEIVQLLQKIK